VSPSGGPSGTPPPPPSEDIPPTEILPTNPPPRIFKPKKDKGSELTKAEREASIAWKQGALSTKGGKLKDQFIVVPPPYTNESKFYTTDVPEGVHIIDGPRSAYDTIRKITGGNLPPEFNLDMGIMDIKITSYREIPKIKFIPDPDQRTRQGHIRVLPRRSSSPRIRTSR